MLCILLARAKSWQATLCTPVPFLHHHPLGMALVADAIGSFRDGKGSATYPAFGDVAALVILQKLGDAGLRVCLF